MILGWVFVYYSSIFDFATDFTLCRTVGIPGADYASSCADEGNPKMSQHFMRTSDLWVSYGSGRRCMTDPQRFTNPRSLVRYVEFEGSKTFRWPSPEVGVSKARTSSDDLATFGYWFEGSLINTLAQRLGCFLMVRKPPTIASFLTRLLMKVSDVNAGRNVAHMSVHRSVVNPLVYPTTRYLAENE